MTIVQNDCGQRKIWAFHQNENVDSFSGAAPRLRGLAKAVFRLARRQGISKPTVLNIGVGNGYLEELILRGGGNALSVDPDEQALVRLAARGVKCYAGSLEYLPLADETVDFTVISEVLEHLDDATRAAGLSEICRVLKSGGYVLGTVPYRENLQQSTTVCPHCGEVFHRWGHKKAFDLAAVKKELTPYFQIEQVTRTSFLAPLRGPKLALGKSLIRLILAKLGEPIAAPSVYFIARKVRGR